MEQNAIKASNESNHGLENYATSLTSFPIVDVLFLNLSVVIEL